MTLVFADRVKETTTTTGTGTYDLAGAVTGFQGFVAGIGDGNTCRYAITDGTDWEVGVGTVTDAAPDTLTRTTVLKSSNGDAAVDWSAGSKSIWCDVDASYIGSLGIILGTAQASTSGTSIDFTGIPTNTKRITVSFVGVSTSGSSIPIIQLGDAGGIETSGYLGAGGILFAGGETLITSTAGLALAGTHSGATVWHGTATFILEEEVNFTWVGTFIGAKSSGAVLMFGATSKSLSAILDRIRITTVGGSETFDLGAINITYEQNRN